MGRFAVCCVMLMTALAPLLTTGQGADSRAVEMWDAYIAGHAANGDFSGIVLVSRHGRRIYEKSVGFAPRAFDVPNRVDTRFLVASVTR